MKKKNEEKKIEPRAQIRESRKVRSASVDLLASLQPIKTLNSIKFHDHGQQNVKERTTRIITKKNWVKRLECGCFFLLSCCSCCCCYISAVLFFRVFSVLVRNGLGTGAAV